MSTNAAAVRENVHGLILYDHPSSPCARRVRITLREKGLPWDTQVIDLSRLEQRSPEYLAINPNGFVPTLAHGDRIIYESNVITEYLDDVFREVPLYPDDLWQLAQVKMWQAAELAMAKDYRPLMYQRLLGPIVRLTRTLDEALAAARRSTGDAADLAWEERVWNLAVLTPTEEAAYEGRLVDWLSHLERALDGRAFLVGDRFTQAEVSVYPRVMMYSFVAVPIDPARFPNVSRWMARCAERSSFSSTLSSADAGLLKLARTPVLPWLRCTLKKPEALRSWSERIRLTLASAAFRRIMAERRESRGDRRGIRKPTKGRVEPATIAAKAGRESCSEAKSWGLTLYDFAYSPHARRLRILMREKGLTWQSHAVDMTVLAHRSPDYLAVNPHGELPALKHGPRLLYDSQIIAEYLDRSFDEAPSLYPCDALEIAEVRMWLALEAGTHKEFRPLFWVHVIGRLLRGRGVAIEDVDRIVAPNVEAPHRDWLRASISASARFDTSETLAREMIRKKLHVLEQHLSDRETLVGRSVTMADIAWFTRVELLPDLGIPIDAEGFPHVSAWRERLARRAAFAAEPYPALACPG